MNQRLLIHNISIISEQRGLYGAKRSAASIQPKALFAPTSISAGVRKIYHLFSKKASHEPGAP